METTRRAKREAIAVLVLEAMAGVTEEAGIEPEMLVRLGSQPPFIAICGKASYAISNELGRLLT